MDFKLNPNAVNQFPKGTDVFKQGEPVSHIAMIIKGRVFIHNEGAKLIMSPGSFLGINDLYLGRYQSTYTALDDLLVYIYPAGKIEELELVLSANKDYHGFMVASFYKMIYELEQICQGLMKNGSELHQFLIDTYQTCFEMAEHSRANQKFHKRISSLVIPDSGLELLGGRINYYIECRNLPIDTVKQFYSFGNSITLYELEEQAGIINEQLEALKEMAENYIRMAQCLVDDSDSNLFKTIAELSEENIPSGNNELLDIMDNIIEEINKAETFTERMLGRKLYVNRKVMEEAYHRILTGNDGAGKKEKSEAKHSDEDTAQALKELDNSFGKILNYAGISGDKTEEMKTVMEEFINLPDKFSADDSSRNIRRQLTENHYLIYKAVFITAYRDSKVPRLIDLFLKYGLADERLLTKEQQLSLYFLKEEGQNPGPCSVYDIKSWLTLIYEGKKEPSKNEFDLDYPEMLTEMKKQGKLTDKETAVWLSDTEKKLDYEIQNMYRYNNRTTNGNISAFVPVLHKDVFSGIYERLLITPSKLNAAVEAIIRIDYSVFDREILYSNKEKKIVKEYIVKKVYPEIILLPNVGVNGIMWQEISGKRRDSSGRFLLPIFTEIDINLLLIRIFGKFRWELCRTIEGASWNDIAQKSLTSEYSDYLQFYRKNKDLSEEKKEKIKLQIQKGRNSSREIFVIDYEQWINFESIGAIKLNKLVREIMATYCPFSKAIREQIRLQPLFDEAMARFYREKQKKIREIEGRYRMLQKDQIEITQELMDTLAYYKDV